MLNDISKNAQNTLSFNPLIINLEPSKKVTLVPVNCTLYLVLSNNWLDLILILSNTRGSLALPMSFILILIRACCRLLSIKVLTSLAKEVAEPLSLFVDK